MAPDWSPFAPGTMRHISRCCDLPPLFAPALDFALIIVLALLALSIYVAGQAEKIYQKKDDQRIVIDEIIGFQITMLPVAITVLHL